MFCTFYLLFISAMAVSNCRSMGRLTFRQFRRKYMVSILAPIISFGSIGLDLNTTRKYKKRLAEEEAASKKIQTDSEISKTGKTVSWNSPFLKSPKFC